MHSNNLKGWNSALVPSFLIDPHDQFVSKIWKRSQNIHLSYMAINELFD